MSIPRVPPSGKQSSVLKVFRDYMRRYRGLNMGKILSLPIIFDFVNFIEIAYYRVYCLKMAAVTNPSKTRMDKLYFQVGLDWP